MDNLLHDMNHTLILTESEKEVYTLPDGLHNGSSSQSSHVLYARVVSSRDFNRKTFRIKMSSFWKGQESATSAHSPSHLHVSTSSFPSNPIPPSTASCFNSSDDVPVIPFPAYLPITPMIATYPPNTLPVQSASRTPFAPVTSPILPPNHSTIVSTNPSATLLSSSHNLKGKAVLISKDECENINPNKQFKRQMDSESLRNVLKRCRSNAIQIQSDSSAPSGTDSSLLVADLIDQHRQWDLTAVSSNFGQAEIDRILSIPLSIFPSEDALIWNGTTSGNYMVKSGYYFATSLAEHQDAGSTYVYENWWSKFWKLKLPSKLRIFVWKVFHNAIPVAAELHRKHIANTPYCPLCKQQQETIPHALFLCTRAKEVWRLSSIKLNFKLAATSSAEEFLFYASDNTSTSDFEQFLTICWSIWYERNAEFHDKSPKQPAAVLAFATDYLGKYQSAQAHFDWFNSENVWD
ncbi:hypothetical protein G4B88_015920 [Cannabis sativa]|uniref:Reverse transcriptase zinc-binding domain-containing protein n=1 Tax=Cannabis sativa TaxID=3483 RepID=A0A7J6ESF6_CANSA|nr:hypothetical protein G4B88_015920 [Cannabis sativa]